MSRFSDFHAQAVAEASTRGQAAPLAGHEATLLAALRAAEDSHDRCRESASADREAEAELQAKMRAKGGEYARAYKRVASGLRSARKAFEDMDDVALRFLGWSAHARGLVKGQARADGNLALRDIGVEVYDLLERAQEVAENARLQLDAGRTPGETQPFGTRSEPTAPLDAFVDVMWAFWTETVGTAPSIESGETVNARGITVTEPKSPALRMMYEATRQLVGEDGRALYELAAVEGSMKRRRIQGS